MLDRENIEFTSVEEVTALVTQMAELFSGSSDGGYHALRDEVMLGALRAIAAGNGEAQEMAKAALLADDIGFARWFE